MAITAAPRQTDPTGHRSRLPFAAAIVIACALVATGLALVIDDLGSSGSGSGVRGSGIAVAQTRTVAPFSSVDLAGSNMVTVAVGVPQSVVVHADSNLVTHVTTQVVGGTLVIGTTGSFSTRAPMNVQIGVPSLTELNLSGSGQITVTGISAPRLAVTLSGSGLLSASGTATRLFVTLSGSGDAQLGQLTADEVHATVTGSGLIQIMAVLRLDAAVPGSGAIIYSGYPQVTTNVTGSGTVAHG
jgi:hypothetical protein